jgi:NADH-quinone oxidoreductase subunit J
MTILQMIFYFYSAIAIFSAMMVVGSTSAVRGALFLVLTFFCMAALWMLLHAEFLALILVLVYVGAVMTLFLFVVMMLNLDRVKLREGLVRFYPIGIIIVLAIFGLTALVVGPSRFGLDNFSIPPAQPADFSNIASLGAVLYTNYAYPFEVAAVLLLTAIIAAISLTHHERKPHKAQVISAQIAVRPEDRLRIVNMPSETKKPDADQDKEDKPS